MNWIDYIAQYTRPTPLPTLAVVPRDPQAALSVTLLCAIRLPNKVTYRDGVKTVREQWSHTVYPAHSEGDWIRVRYMHGYIYRKLEDVRFADTLAESKAA